jgi:CRISPR-associated protein Cas5
MNDVDISILEKIPILEKKVKLLIQPLAPLSLVNDMPGSFYKSLNSPTKKMMCGMFENILGWHIDIEDRNNIIKEIKKLRKKQKQVFIDYKTGSSYLPLLMDYFDIISIDNNDIEFSYNDLWSRSYRREGADVHPKGTANLSYEVIPLKRDNKLIDLFIENPGKFPLYYSTPTNREYIDKNEFTYEMIFDNSFWELLNLRLEDCNLGYLGNSEGWIHIEVKSNE